MNEKRLFYKKVAVFMLPLIAQNLINVGVTAADVIMLGKVGETVLSASSLAGQVQFVMTLFFFGITSGATVLAAQYWGKGDTESIEKVLGMTLFYGVLVATLFTIAAETQPVFLMKLFSNEWAIIENGVTYLRIVAISYILSAITTVYMNLLRSVERVMIASITYFISLIVNVILNGILIFGLLGFPAMGIKGAAIATAVSRMVEFMIAIVYSQRKDLEIHIRACYLFRHDRILMKDFLHFSIPVVLNELLWGSGTSIVTAIMGHMGSAVVAANSVVQMVRQFAMVLTYGVATAAAIMVGKVLGENNLEMGKKYGDRFVKLSIVTGLFGSVMIGIARPACLHFMTLSAISRNYLSFMMIVMMFYVIVQSVTMTIIVGIFRAGGDTRFGAFIDVFFLYCISIALGSIAAFVWKLPVKAVYLFLVSDEFLKIIFVLWRYHSGKWIRNITRA